MILLRRVASQQCFAVLLILWCSSAHAARSWIAKQYYNSGDTAGMANIADYINSTCKPDLFSDVSAFATQIGKQGNYWIHIFCLPGKGTLKVVASSENLGFPYGPTGNLESTIHAIKAKLPATVAGFYNGFFGYAEFLVSRSPPELPLPASKFDAYHVPGLSFDPANPGEISAGIERFVNNKCNLDSLDDVTGFQIQTQTGNYGSTELYIVCKKGVANKPLQVSVRFPIVNQASATASFADVGGMSDTNDAIAKGTLAELNNAETPIKTFAYSNSQRGSNSGGWTIIDVVGVIQLTGPQKSMSK